MSILWEALGVLRAKQVATVRGWCLHDPAWVYQVGRRFAAQLSNFGTCLAVGGAMAAAEDRGYKSGYRTGKQHADDRWKRQINNWAWKP